MKPILPSIALLLACTLSGAETTTNSLPAPQQDRVGFPAGYAATYQVLRSIDKEKDLKVVTVYGNTQAASVTNAAQLPFPNGSIIVMETAAARKDAAGKPELDERGRFRKGQVTGLHVMRREKGYGVDYGPNRTAEWEYVEYRADGSHLTPPQKSAACAECHVKAGAQRDFVYRGRLPVNPATAK